MLRDARCRVLLQSFTAQPTGSEHVLLSQQKSRLRGKENVLIGPWTAVVYQVAVALNHGFGFDQAKPRRAVSL